MKSKRIKQNSLIHPKNKLRRNTNEENGKIFGFQFMSHFSVIDGSSE